MSPYPIRFLGSIWSCATPTRGPTPPYGPSEKTVSPSPKLPCIFFSISSETLKSPPYVDRKVARPRGGVGLPRASPGHSRPDPGLPGGITRSRRPISRPTPGLSHFFIYIFSDFSDLFLAKGSNWPENWAFLGVVRRYTLLRVLGGHACQVLMEFYSPNPPCSIWLT